MNEIKNMLTISRMLFEQLICQNIYFLIVYNAIWRFISVALKHHRSIKGPALGRLAAGPSGPGLRQIDSQLLFNIFFKYRIRVKVKIRRKYINI